MTKNRTTVDLDQPHKSVSYQIPKEDSYEKVGGQMDQGTSPQSFKQVIKVTKKRRRVKQKNFNSKRKFSHSSHNRLYKKSE